MDYRGFQIQMAFLQQKALLLQGYQRVLNMTASEIANKKVQELQAQLPQGFVPPSAVGPLFELPNPQLLQGHEIPLGRINIEGFPQVPFTVPLSLFHTPTLISGVSGTGKTTVLLWMYLLLQQMTKAVTWFVTIEGDEISRIGSMLPPRKILILDASKGFQINPVNQIEGATLEESNNSFMRPLMSLFTREGSAGFMMPFLNQGPAHLGELISMIRKEGKEGDVKRTVLNRLDLIKSSSIFGSKRATDWHLLADTNVIFLCDKLEHYALKFFINLLLAKLLCVRRVQGAQKLTEGTTNVVFCDELQNVAPANNTAREDVNLEGIPMAAQQGRKARVQICSATQSLSATHSSIVAACGQIIAGRVNSLHDERGVGDLLNLTPPQREYFKRMGNRAFLYRAFGLGIPTVPILFPEFPQQRIELDIDAFNRLTILSNPRLASLFEIDVRPVQPEVKPEQEDDFCIFLKCLVANEFLPVTELYKAMQWEVQRCNELRQEMEKQGLVKAHRIVDGGRGSTVSLEPTEAGLRHSGIQRQVKYMRGADFIHTYFGVNTRRWALANGWRADMEVKLGNGHFADIMLSKGDEKIPAEIGIGNAIECEASNLVRDLEEAPKAWLIGNKKDHLAKVIKKLPSSLRGRVISKLFRELR